MAAHWKLALVACALAVAVMALPTEKEEMNVLGDAEEGATYKMDEEHFPEIFKMKRHLDALEKDMQPMAETLMETGEGAGAGEKVPLKDIMAMLQAKLAEKPQQELGESGSPRMDGGWGNPYQRQQPQQPTMQQIMAMMQQQGMGNNPQMLQAMMGQMAAPTPSPTWPRTIDTSKNAIGPWKPHWACKYCWRTCQKWVVNGNTGQCIENCYTLGCTMLGQQLPLSCDCHQYGDPYGPRPGPEKDTDMMTVARRGQAGITGVRLLHPELFHGHE